MNGTLRRKYKDHTIQYSTKSCVTKIEYTSARTFGKSRTLVFAIFWHIDIYASYALMLLLHRCIVKRASLNKKSDDDQSLYSLEACMEEWHF